MASPNSDHPQVTTRQRTVLLATDRSQSIIAEVTDGKHNNIAYCVYGEQSAQQPIATALGFNDQLRERSLGWYILGNGYRAYNPVLMRFHSPDGWSPFGRGGLNAYMYCVGDPVNRVDPTGHNPFLAGLMAARDFAKKHRLFDYGLKPFRHSITLGEAANAARTLQRGRTYGSSHDLSALIDTGAELVRPRRRVSMIGKYPSKGDGSTEGMKWGTTPPFTPSQRTGRIPHQPEINAPRGAGSRGSVKAIGGESPPNYEEATSSPMKFWDANTFANAHGKKDYYVYTEAPNRPNYWPRPKADTLFNPPVDPFDDPELDALRDALAALQNGVRRG